MGGISFLSPSEHQGPHPLCISCLLRLAPWLSGQPSRHTKPQFTLRCDTSLSFLLACFRCCLLSSLASLLVLLGHPPCRFCSSTADSLVVALCHRSHRTSDYSGTCCVFNCALRMLLASYCGRYSPIGSHSLEPALIPLWTPLRSSNHTIYTAPLTVSFL